MSKNSNLTAAKADKNDEFYTRLSDIKNELNQIKDVHITEHNISNIFDYFTSRVVKNSKKISPNDIVAIFIGVITDGNNYYVHPKKPNYICTPFGDIQIDATQYKGFISYFNRTYTPQEKMKFAEISDRLIEDTNRRNKGEFYTPTLFVDYAHKMISEALGDNWKDEYVVWDNCCGTKNLTRDYRFKELYCSTLENAELDISSRYNPEATSFQYDFLNDPLDKLPKGLLEAFEQNKKIVFFLNPPYAKNSGDNIYKNTNETVCNTLVSNYMKGMKEASSNLYCQFLYRILLIKQQYKLNNCHICVFCPTLFLTGQGYANFRKQFLSYFSFSNAIQFKASHFANVADSWGISFSIWNSGENSNNVDFEYEIVDINGNNEVSKIANKTLYNIDNGETASIWLRSDSKDLKTYDVPNMTSAIKVRDGVGSRNGKCCQNAIGYFNNGGNNIDKNTQQVALFTSAYSGAIGASIIPENFYKVVSLFAARKLIEKNWINSKDEYLAPNEYHPKFQEFVNNSIVYSLFNVSSNQASLRQIKYNDKLWDIKNEFFWMSKSEIESLANEFSNDTCYSDVHTSEDRFVYKKLQEITLTPEAQAVLNKACDIVRKTFKYRELFNEEHPEYQINNWDCGWYQIKALTKEYAKEDYDEFVKLYKKLADKMRPMVYELGFLK